MYAIWENSASRTKPMKHTIQHLDINTERFHAFDNLRATLLMLLLVLHSSLAYMVTPLGTLWPHKDGATNIAFDITMLFIHTFRLPLLFAMSGFFGAKLYFERGEFEFVKNRLRRIAIPLVTFWVILSPLVLGGFALIRIDPDSRTFGKLLARLLSADALSHLNLLHLWFLFDLLLYYSATLLLARIFKLTGLTYEQSRLKIELLSINSRLVLLLVGLTALSLVPMELGILETPSSFSRPVSTLIANALFFLFGYGLYIRRDLVCHFAPYAWRYFTLGIASFTVHLACVFLQLTGDSVFHVPSTVFASLSIWLLLFGIMGLFVRYCNKPNCIWRYIADSSYWCYLVHLPLVVWVSILLSRWGAPAILKFSVVLFTTVLVCLVTYDRLVRSTAIGALINGRRHPRRGRPQQTLHEGKKT